MGKSEKVYYGGCGDRTHDPKTHGLSTTPFVKDFSGVSVRLTSNWLTSSLPKLGLITPYTQWPWWITLSLVD